MFENIDWGETILTLVVAFFGSGLANILISYKQDKEFASIKAKLETSTFITNKQFENEIIVIQNLWNKYCTIHGKFECVTDVAINIQLHSMLNVERTEVDEYTQLVVDICNDINRSQPFIEKDVYKLFFNLLNEHRSYIYGLNLMFFHNSEKKFSDYEGYLYKETFNHIKASSNDVASKINSYLNSLMVK